MFNPLAQLSYSQLPYMLGSVPSQTDELIDQVHQPSGNIDPDIRLRDGNA